MPKLQQTVDGQFFLTVPRDLVRAKGWQKGMLFFLAFNQDGDVVLKPEAVKVEAAQKTSF